MQYLTIILVILSVAHNRKSYTQYLEGLDIGGSHTKGS